MWEASSLADNACSSGQFGWIIPLPPVVGHESKYCFELEIGHQWLQKFVYTATRHISKI